MWMDTGGCRITELAGQLHRAPGRGERFGDDHHMGDATEIRALYDFGPVGVELGVAQVAMGIDEHPQSASAMACLPRVGLPVAGLAPGLPAVGAGRGARLVTDSASGHRFRM